MLVVAWNFEDHMPINVLMYVSDHGFGHAVRATEVICSMPVHWSVTVVTGEAQMMLMDTIIGPRRRNVCWRAEALDLGLPLAANGSPIYGLQLQYRVTRWLMELESTAVRELQLMDTVRPALIITDITPIACSVGRKAGVPVIGISNFTWYDQYQGRMEEDYLLSLRDLYCRLSCFVRLPLAMPMEWMATVKQFRANAYGRPIDTEAVHALRDSSCGVRVAVAFGAAYCPPLLDLRKLGPEITIFATEGIAIDAEAPVRYVPTTGGLHNVIAASDVVITKAGWGIVTEALRAGVYVLMLARDVNEDAHIAGVVESLGAGRRIAIAELTEMSFHTLEQYIDLRSATPYTPGGQSLPNALKSAADFCGLT